MPVLPEQLSLPQKPLVLGIGGCSGSGKTTLARELTQHLGATLLPLDYYYRDLSHMPEEERTCQNFDHPASLEAGLLVEHVRALTQGNAVECPVYDFATHTRVPRLVKRLVPAGVILVEGILALHYDDLRSVFDFSIYVDAPHPVCLTRRIYRDVRERGRTEASVREQYQATARPMADKYVLPSAPYASLCVDGTASLDWSVEQVFVGLQRAGLYSGIRQRS